MMKFKGHLPLIMYLLGLIVTTSCTFDTLHEPVIPPAVKYEIPLEPLAQPPKQCLSLSGGGMRAASYGIGVMKALSEFERLNSLDIISGVSGGTYAMLWYYTGIHAMDLPPQTTVLANIFSDENLEEFIHYHNGWSYLAKDSLNSLSVAIGKILEVGLNPLAILAAWYIQLRLKDPLLLTTDATARAIYTGRLEGLYGNAHRPIRSLVELNRLINEQHLPWPIINTTVYDADFSPRWHERKRIFEITPLRVGSESAAYASSTTTRGLFGELRFNRSLLEYVAASGAALDLPEIRSAAMLTTLLGIRLGMPIDSPRVDGKDLFLSDGGFSENLGAYALARRGCQTITIVDAEYDPKYQFESYRVLQDHLEAVGLRLAVHEIESERPTKSLPSTWQFPIMKGKIYPLGHRDDSGPGLEVRYLKLSLPEILVEQRVLKARHCAAGDASGHPSSYYSEKLVKMVGIFNPQISTWNQFLSEDMVRGLIDLGYAHMKAAICTTTTTS